MFRGNYEFNIDAKGRTSLPAKYREALASRGSNRLIITPDLSDPCLVVYPYEKWVEFEEKLDALPKFDKKVRSVKRRIIGSAVELTYDSSGRILIPLALRKERGFETEGSILFVGQLSYMEIWKPENWETDTKENEDPEECHRTLTEFAI